MNQNRSLQRRFTQRGRRRQGRFGLSLLEFLGCLIALIGGAWLGAIYLGIDVHRLTYVALTESDLMQRVPEQWRPAAPEQRPGAPTSEELAQAVQGELIALRHEIAALRTAREAAPAESTSTTNDSSTAKSTTTSTAATPIAREASLAFWNRVGEIVRGELALQFDAESAGTDGNATKVAALKGRISRFASSAIRAVPAEGVDPAAVDVSKNLADWYERAGALYDQAVQIWESPARGQSGSTLSKDWRKAHLQHVNEGRLLQDKVTAVRESLLRRFGDGFADFAVP